MEQDSTRQKYDRLARPVVSADEAVRIPYPYVWVTGKGAVYELDAEDRAYLETPFHPCDSGRPAVKDSFESKNGWGSISGFCARKDVPAHITICPTPVPPEERKSVLEEYGLQFVENADGTGGVIRAKKPRHRMLGFWRRIFRRWN